MPIKFLELPSQERLLELFDYNPETGVLTWKVPNSRRKKGEEAGCITSEGYRIVRIGNLNYHAHRLIWKWMTGKEPNMVDHREGMRNMWSNLRECTPSQNAANRKGPDKGNKYGVRGLRRKKGIWEARVMCEGKRHGKTFPDSKYGGMENAKEAAAKWSEDKRVELFGEFSGRNN